MQFSFSTVIAIVEDIAQAGPDAEKLVTDALTAFSDLRTGKISKADFDLLFADLGKIAGDVLGAK